MAKTSKPLIIVAFPPVSFWGELEKYEQQGHTVIRVDQWAEADVILGPSCWRMDENHRKYLTLAVKAARVAKYPLEKKDAS